MKLSQLKPPAGAVKNRKRLGRGIGSGQGGTSGKGHKGARARAGKEKGPGYEGGQMPLLRRIPKRGFTNRSRKEYTVVNVGTLARFEAGTVVDAQALINAGLIRKMLDGVKILAEGDLNAPLTIIAHKFSAKAKEKILAAGGSCETAKG